MNSPHFPYGKALGLCSGGLDSILAALLLRSQGITVCWLAFETPFFTAEKARTAASKNKIPLIVKDITQRYMAMLTNPRCGYGQGMNPCLDCHALMFRIAGEMLGATQSDFLFSGEVLGQRPMSQTRAGLRFVEKNSGFAGYILRPLSAQLLDPTWMERQGLVNREQLCGFSGRSRKPQMALAEAMGVKEYPAPGGGCLLTDQGYSRRLKDLLDHQAEPGRADLELLKYGRHLRADAHAKIVVGRHKSDNERIMAWYREEQDILIRMNTWPGPVVVIPRGSDVERQTVLWAASVCAGYSKAPRRESAEVILQTPRGREVAAVVPIANEQVQSLMIP
ncbi:MAG TPA: tRNA 4-thiouridine(8) synthase ThiI [Desulfosalsimonadaceae bacterium]|nr:tRNA 4-thiouridine(8) synthase ThiI [Desulfosalsimonadaceae bacterium]